jgi:hypothetical protein
MRVVYWYVWIYDVKVFGSLAGWYNGVFHDGANDRVIVCESVYLIYTVCNDTMGPILLFQAARIMVGSDWRAICDNRARVNSGDPSRRYFFCLYQMKRCSPKWYAVVSEKTLSRAREVLQHGQSTPLLPSRRPALSGHAGDR